MKSEINSKNNKLYINKDLTCDSVVQKCQNAPPPWGDQWVAIGGRDSAPKNGTFHHKFRRSELFRNLCSVSCHKVQLRPEIQPFWGEVKEGKPQWRLQVQSAVPGVGTALDSKAKWNAHPLKTVGKSNDQWRSAVTMSSATLSKQSKGKKEREYKRIYPDRLLNPAKLKWHHSLRPCEQQGQQHIFNFCLCAPAARIWNEEKWAASADLMCFFFFLYFFLLLLLLWWQHARPSGCSAIERGRMELKFFARAVDIHPEQ